MEQQKTPYVGRHRPQIPRSGVVGMAMRQIEGQRRDREAMLYGYNYTPRHSAGVAA